MGTSDNKPSTILIVDDDKTVIEQLVTHFRRRNYEPIATANPTIVQQTLENFEVHLILLDLRMERLDGYQVLKGLRDKGVNIPVLIITAYFKDEESRLKEVGITRDHVIEKPFRDFSVIETSINRELSKVVSPGEVGSDYEDEIYYDNNTKMIIVDDEEEITEILAEVLREREYQVATFKNGQDAINYLKENNGDCHIGIIDMEIPGLLGHEVIAEGLKINSKIKFIPVTAKYVDEMKNRLNSVGFDGKKLLTKPFDLPTLVEQIKVLATEAGTLGANS
ncbi:MAG: response regulator [Candidatus Omnitrophica bacterium]|nr:response regulator [Candidatus Omnitrophota bacterium]